MFKLSLFVIRYTTANTMAETGSTSATVE